MMMLTDAPKPGQLRIIGPSGVSLGGSALNKAVAGHHIYHQFEHRCITPVGNDAFGAIIERLLSEAAPDLTPVLIQIEDGQTSHSYVEVSEGDRSFRHHPGVNDLCCADDIIERLDPTAWATVFGYPALMRQMLVDDGAGTKMLFEQASGLRVLDMVSVDPNSEAGAIEWIKWHENVMPTVDLYCPSAEELLFMLDKQRYTELHVDSATFHTKLIDLIDVALLDELAFRVKEMGCPMVLIKIGPRGAYLSTASEVPMTVPYPDAMRRWSRRELWAPAYREKKFVSSTGAGDIAIAAFVTYALMGCGPMFALAASVGAGAYCIESVGATDNVPTMASLNQRMQDWDQLDCNITEGCGSWYMTAYGKIWVGNQDQTSQA